MSSPLPPIKRDGDLRDSPEAAFRRQVLDRTALALALLTVTGIVARHLSSPVKTLQIVVGIGLAGLALSTPILTRRVKHAAVAALPVCVTMLVLVVGAGMTHGGLRAPVTAILPLLPVLGFFFGGRRLAAALLAGTVAVIVGLLAAADFDLVRQVSGDLGEDRNKAIVLVVLAVTGYVIGAIYERSRRIYETHLVEVSRLVSLGVMAGGIAHEINNPLTIVAGFSGRLLELSRRRELDPGEVQHLAERVVATTRRMGKIVAGLRIYSRDDAREPLRPSSLAGIIDDTLALCSERFRIAGIELRVAEVPAGLTIMARPVQIMQVLLNLLNNAFDAASQSEGRWVELQVAVAPTTYTVSIVDSGAGVPAALRAKIFAPFFTTKDVGKGTGLGLSLCVSIMSKHGGQVTLDADAKATTFVLRFPAAKAGSPNAA